MVGDAEADEQPPSMPGRANSGTKTRGDDQRRRRWRCTSSEAPTMVRHRMHPAVGDLLAQAAQDVLHIDHRVVDQLADGDSQAAQGHGIVDRQAEPVEDQDGRQDGQRDGGQGKSASS